MKNTQIVAISLIGLMSLTAVSNAEDVVLSRSFNENQTEQIEFYVPLEIAAKAPDYSPLSQQNPPLSVKRAVEIGLNAVKKKPGKAEKRDLWSVTISNSYRRGFGGKDYKFWFYDITFTSDSRPFEYAFVLMDGSVAKERVVKLAPAKANKKSD